MYKRGHTIFTLLMAVLLILAGCGSRGRTDGESRWAAGIRQQSERLEIEKTEAPADTDNMTEAADETDMPQTELPETESLQTEPIPEESQLPDIPETAEIPETQAPPADPIVIVLDPGHDDICCRNHPDLGVNEQDLNLKIALACRDELEKYEGVIVYMTREDGSCPDNGIGSDDVTGRTAYAESVGADLFVSLHNNATGLGYPSEANGTEIYVTVYAPMTDESHKLGECIMHELTTRVGLTNRGVLTRIKEEKGTYDNGQIQDWYYLISTSVERGFPGIIVEHAFMDNPHDLELLKDDAQLAAMGVADAIGIANYFQLERR